jgi:hypothetical protein
VASHGAPSAAAGRQTRVAVAQARPASQGVPVRRQAPPLRPPVFTQRLAVVQSSPVSQRGAAARQTPVTAPSATQVLAVPAVTHALPAAQALATPLASQAAPAATAVRQRELVLVTAPEHARPASQAEPAARQRAPAAAPSATQVLAPAAVRQRLPATQALAAPVGSHAPPMATAAISVTVSS